MEILRHIRCARCGASVESHGGEEIVFCRYCGTYSNPNGTVYIPDPDKRSRQLKKAMNEALEENDIEKWRLFMYEACMLDVKRNPNVYKCEHLDNTELRGHVSRMVKQYELLNFNEDINKAFAECQRLADRLSKIKDDHLKACRDLLEAYRKYFNAILYHPEYPFEAIPGDAEQQALDTARSAITLFTSKWGKDVSNTIMISLFGDKEIDSGEIICDSCGSRMDIAKSSAMKCPKCGKFIYLNG